MTTFRYALAGLSVLFVLAGAAWWLVPQVPGRADLVKATQFPEPKPLPEFTLTGSDGRPVTRASLEGNWHLLFFGFANCPDICPLTLSRLASARAQLVEGGRSAAPDILFVSVDPARDTPEVLAEYAGKFGAGVQAATGDPAALAPLAESLGVYFDVPEDAAGDYSVSHSAAVFVTNPDGELAAVFSAPQDVAALVNDLPIVMASR